MSASFQRDEEGVDHQETMPEVRGPEELPPEYESWQKIKHLIPERVRDLFTKKKVIEFRPVTAIDYLSPKRLPPVQDVWLKVIEPMPDDRALHRAVLAYISDFKLLGTALLPHGLTFFHPGTEIASLDHALWFHRDFRIDDWLLYSMYSPSASASRGFNRGNFFTREGKLVASVSQEGLIRNR